MTLFWVSREPWLDVTVLALAFILDRLWSEPPLPLHPVVWMGKTIAYLERLVPRKGRLGPFSCGLLTALAVPGAFGLLAYGAAHGLYALGPVWYLVGGAVLLKSTFSVRMLAQAVGQVGRDLEDGHLEDARAHLRDLVRRDSATLSPGLVASAAVESASENTTDSFVGPWLAFAFLGLPGAFAYRAINTLDSMIGYRGQYEYLGKASARLDDLANLVPARLSALLLIVASWVRRLDAGRAWRVMWRDKGVTASPNAGWTMSAAAGALGVQLEKVGFYRLGEPAPLPAPVQVMEAAALVRLVARLGLVSMAGLALVVRYGIF